MTLAEKYYWPNPSEQEIKLAEESLVKLAEKYEDDFRDITRCISAWLFGSERALLTGEWRATRIEELELTVKAYNAVKRSLNLLSVGELTEISGSSITGVKGVGKAGLIDVEQKLARFGLTLLG